MLWFSLGYVAPTRCPYRSWLAALAARALCIPRAGKHGQSKPANKHGTVPCSRSSYSFEFATMIDSSTLARIFAALSPLHPRWRK